MSIFLFTPAQSLLALMLQDHAPIHQGKVPLVQEIVSTNPSVFCWSCGSPLNFYLSLVLTIGRLSNLFKIKALQTKFKITAGTHCLGYSLQRLKMFHGEGWILLHSSHKMVCFLNSKRYIDEFTTFEFVVGCRVLGQSDVESKSLY